MKKKLVLQIVEGQINMEGNQIEMTSCDIISKKRQLEGYTLESKADYPDCPDCPLNEVIRLTNFCGRKEPLQQVVKDLEVAPIATFTNINRIQDFIHDSYERAVHEADRLKMC